MPLRLDEHVPESPDSTVGDEVQGVLIDEWADKGPLAPVLLTDQAVLVSHGTASPRL